jgi:CDP-diacylglycerol pyrophosphatase
MRAKQNWPIGILGRKVARRIALFAVAALIVIGGFASTFLAVATERQALWQVVRACLANYSLTGVAFPCLEVNLAGGVEQGYVVLRAPFGARDTILTPTRRIVGIEDPWLQAPGAPNLFDAAWNARKLVKSLDGRPPGRQEAALAVNSELLRSQDQLHIHIGCLVPSARRKLEALGATLRIGEWTQVEGVLSRSEVWALRSGRANLADIEPFRLAAERFGATTLDQKSLAIAVAEVRLANRDEFFLLASRPDASENGGPAKAEGIVDPVCHREDASDPD